ncbi:MAG: endo-1,4-beta-xylanase [Pseudanabaenales cyanobacterium]|nr:endo-1,4-beta-xylanase [Pseudanabaenales cyanobacterium]
MAILIMNQMLRELADNLGFKIGTAIQAKLLIHDQYCDVVAKHFNLVAPATELKIHTIRPTPYTWNFANADRIVEFAQKHRQSVRGHTLCWHLSRCEWMKNLTSLELETVLRDFIFETLRRYRGKIYAWDVVNEAINDQARPHPSLWRQVENFIPKCFQWAHQADPDAELMYLDYRVHTLARWKAITKMVRELKAADIPIHGVGMQLHHEVFRSLAIGHLRLAAAIQDLSSLGINIHVSEVTIAIPPASQALPAAIKNQTQAAAYRQLLKASLEGGAKSFTVWGCTDRFIGHVPKESTPGLFDLNYQPKPAYFALVNELSQWQERAA